MLDRRKQKKPSIDRARGKRTSIGENVRGETCRRDSRREEEGKKGERRRRRGRRKKGTRGRDAVGNYATELDAIDGRAFRAELQDSTTSFHFPNSRREAKRTP